MDNKDFFDGMFDFNGDGHTDILETYMAYRIATDSEDDDSYTPRRSSHSSSSGSGWTAVIVTIVILILIGWFLGGCGKQSAGQSTITSYHGSSQSGGAAFSCQIKTPPVSRPVTEKSASRTYFSRYFYQK